MLAIFYFSYMNDPLHNSAMLPRRASNIFTMVSSIDGRNLSDEAFKLVSQILSPAELELIQTDEFLRLKDVSQTNSRLTVRAKGQTHTRYLHSIQAAVAAHWVCMNLGVSEPVRRTVVTILLLHDIAHPPFNHLGEEILHELGRPYDHDKEARKIIERPSISALLRKNGVDPEIAASVVEESGKYPNLEALKNVLDRTYLHDDIASSTHSYHKNIDATTVLNNMLSTIRYSPVRGVERLSVRDFEKRGRIYFEAQAVIDFMNLRQRSYSETTYHPFSMLAKHLLTTGIKQSGMTPQEFLTNKESQTLRRLSPFYREAFEHGVELYYRAITIPLSSFSKKGLAIVCNKDFLRAFEKFVREHNSTEKKGKKLKKRDFFALVTPDYSKTTEVVTKNPSGKGFVTGTLSTKVSLDDRHLIIYISSQITAEDVIQLATGAVNKLKKLILKVPKHKKVKD